MKSLFLVKFQRVLEKNALQLVKLNVSRTFIFVLMYVYCMERCGHSFGSLYQFVPVWYQQKRIKRLNFPTIYREMFVSVFSLSL